MRRRVRTSIGCALIVLAFGMLVFWLYAFAITALITGVLLLFWKRAPEPIW